MFYEKAKELLENPDPSAPKPLPDLQALGVLSLYYLRCGREPEAEECAQSFATSMDNLRRHPPKKEEVEGYTQSLNLSFCGAVSLTRYVVHRT
jgi:hypothetical protein